MKEIKTNKGVLKYRLPNIAEGYEYLAACDSVKTGSDVHRVIGRFISMMSDLIDYKSVGYETYQEALEDKENMYEPLSFIAREIFDDILAVLAKKSLSPTQST
jgi:hypothetical protein